MFAIGILLLLVSYIFAVMFTQLFKHLYAQGVTGEDYFGRMDLTFFTLFQIMTLDNWAEIAREVMKAKDLGWAWLPFIVFVIVTGFVVVNLIIAVICDAISALQDDDKAKLHGTFEERDGESEVSDEDYEGDEGDHSRHPESVSSGVVEVQVQLDILEHHMVQLAQMQEQTMRTVEILTQKLQQLHDTTIQSVS